MLEKQIFSNKSFVRETKDFKMSFRHSLTLFVCKQVTEQKGNLAYLSIYCGYNKSRDFEKWFPTIYPFYITADLLLKQK